MSGDCMDFSRVCKVAERVIRPYLGRDKEVLIGLCRCGGLTDVCPGNVVEGDEDFVRGILYCKEGEFFGSVHNHPTKPDIPSTVDIYQYLSGTLGGYMCIASEETGYISCYWLTRTYHAKEVVKLVDIMNKLIRAYNNKDSQNVRRYTIEAKKFMVKYRCCRTRWRK